jgi:pimeloyl-ACP methyl ester carboxylesterase
VIVIGFVGGTVKHDNPIRSEVILAEHLRAEYPSGVYVETFENRRREKALHAILTQLGVDRSGLLSENEKRQARIILYGHSWGGATMVELARELDKRGIPVLLTVQVDSVRRFGVDDSVIPPNVARAANFYQPNGMIRGREEIRAADSAKTQILGNFRYDYKEHPIRCPEYPWYDRSFAKAHTEIECDPAVWSRVEALIRQQIAPATTK